jgi:hypothetical protein
MWVLLELVLLERQAHKELRVTLETLEQLELAYKEQLERKESKVIQERKDYKETQVKVFKVIQALEIKATQEIKATLETLERLVLLELESIGLVIGIVARLMMRTMQFNMKALRIFQTWVLI